MDCLTTEQAAKVHDAVRPMGGYLFQLVARMDKTNLRNADPKLYRLARAAEEAVDSLWNEVFCQSCAHGVGRPPADGGIDQSPGPGCGSADGRP